MDNVISVKTVIIKSWEQELRDWYAANPPKVKLDNHYYRNRVTTVVPHMDRSVLIDKVKRIMSGEIIAAALKITVGQTLVRTDEQFNRKLGRMEAYRKMKEMDFLSSLLIIGTDRIARLRFEEVRTTGSPMVIEYSCHLTKDTDTRSKLVSIGSWAHEIFYRSYR